MTDQGPRADEVNAVEVAVLLIEVNKGLHKRLEEASAGRKRLTMPQVFVIRILANRPGISLTELSREMGLANSTVSGIIDRLERDGFVVREQDSGDRRVFRVSITPLARAFREEFLASSNAAMSDALRQLPPLDLVNLHTSLAALARILREED